jgi:serine/threonine-protein kinase
LLAGRLRDPLVGRDVLVGLAAGMIVALSIDARELIPLLLHRTQTTPSLPISWGLFGARYAVAASLFAVLRALQNALQCVCVLVFFKILVRRTGLAIVLSMAGLLPIAMSRVDIGGQPTVILALVAGGVALAFGVLLRFGIFALVTMFYTFLVLDLFPLTTDLTRPYVGTSVVLLAAIAGLSAYGFYASRGREPLFGRALLDA